MNSFPLRRHGVLAAPPTVAQQAGLIARNPHLSARARLALRLASIAALAAGGVALGHGVVGLASSRSHPVEAASVRAGLPDAPGAAAPQFTSNMRSWTRAGVASASNPAGVQAVPQTSLPASQSPPQQTNGSASSGSQSYAGGSAAASQTDRRGSAVGSQTYTVRPGDTLSQIAERFGIDVDVLAAANQVTDVNVLSPGVELRIPDASTPPQFATLPVVPAAARPSVRPVEIPAATPTSAQVPVPAAQSAVQAVPARRDGMAQGSAGQPGVATGAGGPMVGGELASISPDAAIRSFYALVAQGEFDRAAGLWSQRMRSSYPPAENIASRFANTQALTVTRADVVQLDASSGRATVAVSLSEVLGSQPSTTRHYVGDWYLVRGPAGWLLDQPSLQAS